MTCARTVLTEPTRSLCYSEDYKRNRLLCLWWIITIIWSNPCVIWQYKDTEAVIPLACNLFVSKCMCNFKANRPGKPGRAESRLVLPWQINVIRCLWKEEIIQRLGQRKTFIPQFSQYLFSEPQPAWSSAGRDYCCLLGFFPFLPL